MLVLARPDDLGFMTDGVGAMQAENVKDFLLGRGCVIDENELAIQIEPRDRKQDGGEACRGELGVVARGNDDARHQQSP
jgi:hypothetical protein